MNKKPDPSDYVMKANPPKPKAEGATTFRIDLTRDEWSALADSKLQEILQTASGGLLLAAIRETKDRLEGKPVQSVNQKTIVAMVDLAEIKKYADQQAEEYLERIAKL